MSEKFPEADISEELQAESVLLLAPTGRDAIVAKEILDRIDVSCLICKSFERLLQYLARGYGPAIIAAEALKPEETAKLNELLEHQPQWSDVPLIVFVSPANTPKNLDTIAFRHSTTLLHRPVKAATFATLVQAALKSRRRQYEVRDLLGQLEKHTQQLQNLALELTQAEELERQKIASLLHDDLQQILAAARFRLALLPKKMREEKTDEAMADLSNLLQEAIEKARNLSHELSPPTLRQHGLAAGLEWLAERMKQLHSLQVDVDVDNDAEPEHMFLKVFLFRAAQEFLFNAVKHAETDRAQLRVRPKGENIELNIVDKGVGFDIAELQVDRVGWGLFSIQERVKLLGGTLEISSEIGCGSTFKLTIPRKLDGASVLAEEEKEHLTAAELGVPPAIKRPGVRVMLVDDHSVLRSGLSMLLGEESDIEIVAEAENGSEAVELAEKLHPDVVLMDVAMPGMDGIEATRLIKKQNPEIRIIGLSMLNDPETAARIEEAGAELHLSKADSGEHLIEAVHSLRKRE